MSSNIKNINIVNNYFARKCTRNNAPLTARHLLSIIKKYNVDLDKPLVVEIDGCYYPIEDVYVVNKDDKDDEPDEMNGCLIIDMDIC